VGEQALADLGFPPGWAAALHAGFLFRIVLAAFLGGVIGLEREMSGKPAGLRTNLLICVGAAMLTDLSVGFGNAFGADPARVDPSRIAAQVVTGIGFLGAGTILQTRGRVTGLTTAATLWVVAAVGMSVGAHAYVAATEATAIVLIALTILGRIENTLLRRRAFHRYTFSLDADTALLSTLEGAFRGSGLQVRGESLERGPDGFHAVFEVTGPARVHEQMARSLVMLPGVHRMTRGE
jgi:putative Mg2+ transporter-C (MgtC) family protein